MKENKIGVRMPHILVPAEGVDYEKWAVVACDQFTSEPEYWEETERIVGSSPSTLRIMLPELYLESPDEADRIKRVRETMDKYMQEGVLQDLGEGCVVVKRTAMGKTRLGVVLALDLEHYDYNKGSETLIRATEGTIVERIPPRLRIREGAPLEMPHIIVLIDDPNKTVIEPLFAQCEKSGMKHLYDFDLMQDGGHISSYFVNDEPTLNGIVEKLEALVKSVDGMAPLLFAMGDGNHSFATAKANWEKIKATLPESERETHPARYALVELENLHDEGIVFEPIHRVLFNVQPRDMVVRLRDAMREHAETCEIEFCFSEQEWRERIADYNRYKNLHVLPFEADGMLGFFKVLNPEAQLEAGSLQTAIDAVMAELGLSKQTIDYVHGDDVVKRLAQKSGNIGFYLPPMDKNKLFPTVMREGALPRKTFSMGEAQEKRYYLECRKIF